MATTTTTTNKPLNPRAQDLSPKGYNRAALFSGKALDFDGVNDVITGSSAALPSSDYTIAAWFNLDTLKASGILVWGDDSFNERRSMFIWNGASGTNWYISSDMYGNNVLGTTPLQAGRWYFAVVCRSASNVATIYLNGKLDRNASHPAAAAAYTNTDFRLGDTRVNEFIDGKIAGVRVFNQVLTAAQVADLYLNPEKITPDGVATSALKLWLPMMEGAGASAYDGSGNGNDGTINGATWTAGVGAPVAQTALVSWNKGTNRLLYSEALNDAAWTKANGTITANAATAPNGTTTADQITSTSTSLENYTRQAAGVGISAGTTLTTMAYAKKGTHTFFRMRNLFVDNGGDFGNAWFNLDTGAVATIQSGQTATMTAVGDGWYLCTLTGAIGTTNAPLLVDLGTATTDGSNVPTTNGSTFVWGVSNYVGAVGAPYIKTNATAQTSAVLVPEGLTAGASIFGTDIITPRNAFALNLDGASWAQVGDNASLDVTAAVTLEAWVYWDGTQISKGILGRYSNPDFSFLLYANSGTRVDAYFAQSGSTSYNSMAVGWRHIVGTFNGNIQIVYIDGVNVASAVNPHTMSAGTKPIEIGRYDQNAGLAYGNQLANPRIYNRALTAAEVLRNYNADKAKFGL